MNGPGWTAQLRGYSPDSPAQWTKSQHLCPISSNWATNGTANKGRWYIFAALNVSFNKKFTRHESATCPTWPWRKQFIFGVLGPRPCHFPDSCAECNLIAIFKRLTIRFAFAPQANWAFFSTSTLFQRMPTLIAFIPFYLFIRSHISQIHRLWINRLGPAIKRQFSHGFVNS